MHSDDYYYTDHYGLYQMSYEECEYMLDDYVKFVVSASKNEVAYGQIVSFTQGWVTIDGEPIEEMFFVKRFDNGDEYEVPFSELTFITNEEAMLAKLSKW